MNTKINWTTSEQMAVKESLKELLKENKHSKQPWAHLLFVAQHNALQSNRWRKENGLRPGIFRDSKSGELRWGSPRDIVFEALRELELIPQDQRRRDPFPCRENLRVPRKATSEKSPGAFTNPAPRPVPFRPVTEAEPAIQRLRQLEKEHADALTKIRELETERSEARILARLEQLSTTVQEITDFITSHGYPARSGPDSPNRVALTKGFAA